MSKSWYAIYTKSRSEKAVSERLAREGIEVYCPLRTELRQWSDRKKKIETPVFPSYVFVRVQEKERLKVLETPGVMNFVFWLGKPAIIRDQEIDAIRRFLDEYPIAFVRGIEVSKGQKVKVAFGQLSGAEGVVTEIRKSTVVLRLDTVGFEMYAEVNKSIVDTHPSNDNNL